MALPSPHPQRGVLGLILLLGIGAILSMLVLTAQQLAHLDTHRLQERKHNVLATHEVFLRLVEESRSEEGALSATASHGKVTITRKIMLLGPRQLLGGSLWESFGLIDFSSLLLNAERCTEQCTLSRPQTSKRWSQFCCATLPPQGSARGNLIIDSLTMPFQQAVVATGTILIEELTTEFPMLIAAGGLIRIGQLRSPVPVDIVLASASSEVEIDNLGGQISLSLITPSQMRGVFPNPHIPLIEDEIVGLGR